MGSSINTKSEIDIDEVQSCRNKKNVFTYFGIEICLLQGIKCSPIGRSLRSRSDINNPNRHKIIYILFCGVSILIKAVSRYGKKYQIYPLKSRNTSQDLELLNAETETTWSYYYCNFNCNCRHRNTPCRNRISCYWATHRNKLSFHSVRCHIVSNWCRISCHGLWIMERKGMGMDYFHNSIDYWNYHRHYLPSENDCNRILQNWFKPFRSYRKHSH
jgi:hypothetical protein